MIKIWNRDAVRSVLIGLGGTSTGGGQSLCGTSWDECADFVTPEGRELSVMFSLDDDRANFGLFAREATLVTIMRHAGDPAEVLKTLVDQLTALGCRTRTIMA